MRECDCVNFGISTASFYPMVLEEAIGELAKNNIKNIEIFLNTYSDLNINYINEINKIIKGNGMSVKSTHPFTSGFEPFMLFTEYKKRTDDAMEFHKQYFQAMNLLGSEIFVFHGDRKESEICDCEYFERFAQLRDIGKEFGIKVAQENVQRCKSGSLEFLKNMVKYLHNDVALVFDNKQAVRSGIDYIDFIKSVGENIVHVHISDSNQNCDCMAVGKGKSNIGKLVSHLHDIGFSGCMVVELYSKMLDSLDDIFDSYNQLNSIYFTNIQVESL